LPGGNGLSLLWERELRQPINGLWAPFPRYRFSCDLTTGCGAWGNTWKEKGRDRLAASPASFRAVLAWGWHGEIAHAIGQPRRCVLSFKFMGKIWCTRQDSNL